MPHVSDVSNAPAPPFRDAPAFHCTLNTGGRRAAWVRVAGELDLVTARHLARVLRKGALHARLVVADMRDVTFIDSSGVHVLLDATHGVDWGGARLMVVPGPVVEHMLAICGASRQVDTFDLSPSEPTPSLHLVV